MRLMTKFCQFCTVLEHHHHLAVLYARYRYGYSSTNLEYRDVELSDQCYTMQVRVTEKGCLMT